MKYLIVSLISLMLFQSAKADATAVFGCGFTSDGIYRCSDLNPRLTPNRQQSEVPLRKKILSKVLNAKIVGYSKQFQGNAVIGYYDIELQFCGPISVNSEPTKVEWKKQGEGKYLVNHSNSYDSLAWVLGGAPSTIKEIHFGLSYTTTVHPGVVSADSCYVNKKMIHLFCQLLTGYDGAGCNFVVNGSQTLAIELFRNHLNEPSLILY